MQVSLNKTTYDVPTNWGDIKYIDFAKSQTKGLSLEKKLSYHTTIPETEISKLPLSELGKLIPVIAFRDSLPEMFEQVSLDFEIGNEHYIKLEQSRKFLENSENQWVAAIDIVKLYTDKDITDLSVVEAFGYAVFFLNRLTGS